MIDVRSWPMLHKSLAAGVLVLLLTAAAYWFWPGGSSSAPEYREVKVTRGDIESTVLTTGVVQPRNRLEIKPPISGRVERVLVDVGRIVRKGTVLAWMSSSERAALLDAARAKGPEEVARWKELYNATPIVAPIDGTVILRNVEPGQSFTSNDAVFVISDRLVVTAQVDETDLSQVRAGQPARLELDAYPGEVFEGQVEQIAHDAKTVNNVTTYTVHILPKRVPAFMRSGMTVNVTFLVAVRKDVLLVPADAVRTMNGRNTVLVKKAKGEEQEEREVKTGLSNGKLTELQDGAGEGEVLLAVRLKSTQRSSKPSSPFSPTRR